MDIKNFEYLNKYDRIYNKPTGYNHINILYSISKDNLKSDNDLYMCIDKLLRQIHLLTINPSSELISIIEGFVFDDDVCNIEVNYPYYLYYYREERLDIEQKDFHKIYPYITNNNMYFNLILYKRYLTLRSIYGNILKINDHNKNLADSVLKHIDLDAPVYITKYPYYLLNHREEREKLLKKKMNWIKSLMI